MNENRRDFLKKAALFSGGMGLWGVLPASIEKAMAINPEPGTTFLDAEHVVLLMQENRSFVDTMTQEPFHCPTKTKFGSNVTRTEMLLPLLGLI